jgi:outer membrane protein TolC
MKLSLSISFCLLFFVHFSNAQSVLSIDSVLSIIEKNNPVVQMYNAEIHSSDDEAKGAKSWSPPEFGAGLWMMPYNFMKAKSPEMNNGQGFFMISAEQMFPNKKELNANASYMQAVSSVNKEKMNFSLNELYAEAKKNYYDWLINQKKLIVLDDNEKLLKFMIESAELRYKNNLGKLNAYYKVKAALGNTENQRLKFLNEIQQSRSMLNTLMNRDKNENFVIDTNYVVKDFNRVDSNYFVSSRSDIKALQQDENINQLQLNLEKAKQLPQFGLQYEHMVSLGRDPWMFSLMATVKIPLAPWSSGSYKAKVESLKWKAKSFEAQKQMILNEATGKANGMLASISSKKKQIQLFEQNIIPALQKNFKVIQLGYEQNTEELFELFDAWETLNMTQLDYLDQLQELLNLQTEMDKIMEQK